MNQNKERFSMKIKNGQIRTHKAHYLLLTTKIYGANIFSIRTKQFKYIEYQVERISPQPKIDWVSSRRSPLLFLIIFQN